MKWSLRALVASAFLVPSGVAASIINYSVTYELASVEIYGFSNLMAYNTDPGAAPLEGFDCTSGSGTRCHAGTRRLDVLGRSETVEFRTSRLRSGGAWTSAREAFGGHSVEVNLLIDESALGYTGVLDYTNPAFGFSADCSGPAHACYSIFGDRRGWWVREFSETGFNFNAEADYVLTQSTDDHITYLDDGLYSLRMDGYALESYGIGLEYRAVSKDVTVLNPIPLPASFLFLLAGLAGLGLQARRRTV